MKVAFFIVKGKAEMSSIYVRFADSIRIDQKTKTGFYVSSKDWSESKQEVKNTSKSTVKDFTNSSLRNIKNFLQDNYLVDYNTQQTIGKDWLKNQIISFSGRTKTDEGYKIYFVDWIKKYIDSCPNLLQDGKPIAKTSIQRYEVAKNKLLNFEKHYKTRLRFQDINLEFRSKFIQYCQSVERINNNTIGGYIVIIKKWCKIIEIEGTSINQQYKHSEFKRISNSTKDVYLNESEITTVYNHDFSDHESYDNVRDIFIIGLRTGLRISDFMNLTKENITGDFINVVTLKTDTPVIIPLHPQVKAILQKRNGNPPRPISDAKFNKYVKNVCKEIGFTEMIEGGKMVDKSIDKKYFPETDVEHRNTFRKEFSLYPKHELISSHTCRRSFATNLYGKLDNMTIMAITGHQSESQFKKYIKITSTEFAKKLSSHWEKEQADEKEVK